MSRVIRRSSTRLGGPRRAGAPHLTSVIVLVAALGVVAGLTWLPVADLTRGASRSTGESVSLLSVQGWGFFTKSPRLAHVVPYRPGRTAGPLPSAGRTVRRASRSAGTGRRG